MRPRSRACRSPATSPTHEAPGTGAKAVPEPATPAKVTPEVKGHDVSRLDEFSGATQLLLTTTPCALFADGHVACAPGPLAEAWKAERAMEFLATNGELAGLRGATGVRCAERKLPLPDEPVPALQGGVPADASRLALGKDHGCAVTSGKATCWGRASEGQLGAGDGAQGESREGVRIPWPR